VDITRKLLEQSTDMVKDLDFVALYTSEHQNPSTRRRNPSTALESSSPSHVRQLPSSPGCT
jgi:hypothetical protein